MRTKWLGGKRPGVRAPWPVRGVAAVELHAPRVFVATITDNDVRRVGLAFEQDGVTVEVRLPDPHETLRELGEAVEWLESEDD